VETNVLTILKSGGYSMVVIGLCSIAAIAVAIERLVALWNFDGKARAAADAVTRELLRADLDAARARCEESTSLAADVFLAGLAAASPRPPAMRVGAPIPAGDIAKVAAAMDRARQEANLVLRRRLWILGTVGAIAPFVGLFGTVVGIMNAFRHMAVTGQGGFAVVASGISEALITTAGGIAVAIAAVVLYNVFNVHVNRLALVLRLLTDEVQEVVGEVLPALRGKSEPRPAGAKEA
jgi:biopolymer transport protein ExbB